MTEEEEIVAEIIKANKAALCELIGLFAEAPDEQVPGFLKDKCKSFNSSQDPVPFLRDMFDTMLATQQGSKFVIRAIKDGLEYFPAEDAEEAALRQANLRDSLVKEGHYTLPEDANNS